MRLYHGVNRALTELLFSLTIIITEWTTIEMRMYACELNKCQFWLKTGTVQIVILLKMWIILDYIIVQACENYSYCGLKEIKVSTTIYVECFLFCLYCSASSTSVMSLG